MENFLDFLQVWSFPRQTISIEVSWPYNLKKVDFETFCAILDRAPFEPKNGPDMEIFEIFFKYCNLHPKRFPSRGHDTILWKKWILAHFGPKMGPIWKFSNFFFKFLISTPNEFHRGVMTLCSEKSRKMAISGWFLIKKRCFLTFFQKSGFSIIF